MPTVTIRGHVIHASTKKPLAGALVNYFGPEWLAQQTDADGKFELRDLTLSRYSTLEVRHEDLPADAVVRLTSLEEKNTVPGRLDELTIEFRQFAKVSGIVVEAQTGRHPLLPMSVWIGESKEQNGWRQEWFGYASLQAGENRLELSAPIGAMQVKIKDGSGMRVFGDNVSTLQVPPQGLENAVIKAQRNPGVLLRLPKEKDYKGLSLWWRTATGRRSMSNSGYYFEPAKEWGEAMEFRVTINRGKELVPWTKVVANPKQWPMEFELPKPLR